MIFILLNFFIDVDIFIFTSVKQLHKECSLEIRMEYTRGTNICRSAHNAADICTYGGYVMKEGYKLNIEKLITLLYVRF